MAIAMVVLGVCLVPAGAACIFLAGYLFGTANERGRERGDWP